MITQFKQSLNWLIVGLLASLPFVANAQLNVVATTNSLGMLVNEIGADEVSITVLAAPDRDTHYLNARPSFMAALRRADMLVEVGAGLEEGWLPAAQKGAANTTINSGDAHFVAAKALHLRRSITQDGPNIGHVHGEGNPHFTADPKRMAVLAKALATRLATLDPIHADAYHMRAKRLTKQLIEHANQLAKGMTRQRIVVYHEDLDYLEEWLPVEVIGYLEPIPGIPPTASHLSKLVQTLLGQKGVILYASHQPKKGAQFLQSKLDWPARSVSLEPQQPTWESYSQLMQSWVTALDQT